MFFGGFLLAISVSFANAQLFNDDYMKLLKAASLINDNYVDTINQTKLVENAIIGMLKELDPHSSYLTPKEVKEMNEPLQGNFEGIGVSFNILNDTIFIINAIPGGPSEKLGILAGDKIIKIDGIKVAGVGIKNQDVFSKLRGNKGTKVTVSILRKGEKQLLDFTIVRDKIPIYSIDASYMIAPQTGYIKINRFAQTTGKEFNTAMNKLASSGMANLIIDLTGNGGGYLEEAVRLAEYFLEQGKLIVFTRGEHSVKQEYKSMSPGQFSKGKLVILIDESSASASEILSGAIQDWDRGIIVGRRSFGKGLVQRPFMFNDGSMLKLTVAKYYTPSGRLIQKPYENGIDDYEKDIINRYNKGEFVNKDSIHFPDSLKCYTLNLKRVIYGGGGIMPDYFVPIDTSDYSDYYRDILRKGLINKFVLNYIDQNRNSLKASYPTFEKFNTNFNAEDELFNNLLTFAEKEGLKKNEEQIKTSHKALVRLLKAYVARDLWDSSEFYQVINEADPIIKQGVKVIQNWETMKPNAPKK